MDILRQSPLTLTLAAHEYNTTPKLILGCAFLHQIYAKRISVDIRFVKEADL